MRSRLSWIMLAVLATLIVFVIYDTTCASPPVQKWGPFTGQVVDAETGKPIPGAIFVVIWLRNFVVPFHDVQWFNQARIAVADQDGNFKVPGRWPPLLSSLITPPLISCIAPGYAPYVIDAGPQRVSPIFVKMRALAQEKHRTVRSWDAGIGMIPHDRRKSLEATINEARRRLGLATVNFASSAGW